MENNTEGKVKELIADFKLDEALDVLIVQAQTQTQRKQNALLVLKGKLAMLEEQSLAGILDHKEVAQQKAAIAHQILDIADGSSLDHELPQPKPEQVLVQKTVSVPANSSPLVKYLLIGFGVFVVVFVLLNFLPIIPDSGGAAQTEQAQPKQPTDSSDAEEAVSEENTTEPVQPSQPSGDGIKVLDFPNYRKKFNFLDLQFDIQDVEAEAYSDSETKLTIRYHFKCRNNAGICYRATPRVYADERAIRPDFQSNTAAWIDKDSSSTDEINFVLPNNAKKYLIELSRDGSKWSRPFKLLR